VLVKESIKHLTPKSEEEVKKSIEGMSPKQKMEFATEHNISWLKEQALKELEPKLKKQTPVFFNLYEHLKSFLGTEYNYDFEYYGGSTYGSKGDLDYNLRMTFSADKVYFLINQRGTGKNSDRAWIKVAKPKEKIHIFTDEEPIQTIDDLNNYLEKKIKEVKDVNESIKHLKPKTEEEIFNSFSQKDKDLIKKLCAKIDYPYQIFFEFNNRDYLLNYDKYWYNWDLFIYTPLEPTAAGSKWRSTSYYVESFEELEHFLKIEKQRPSLRESIKHLTPKSEDEIKRTMTLDDWRSHLYEKGMDFFDSSESEFVDFIYETLKKDEVLKYLIGKELVYYQPYPSPVSSSTMQYVEIWEKKCDYPIILETIINNLPRQDVKLLLELLDPDSTKLMTEAIKHLPGRSEKEIEKNINTRDIINYIAELNNDIEDVSQIMEYDDPGSYIARLIDDESLIGLSNRELWNIKNKWIKKLRKALDEKDKKIEKEIQRWRNKIYKKYPLLKNIQKREFYGTDDHVFNIWHISSRGNKWYVSTLNYDHSDCTFTKKEVEQLKQYLYDINRQSYFVDEE